MLEIKNINVTFNKNTKLERNILNNLNLSVSKGEFVTIIGDNGAGKSTLFNIISGYLMSDTGSIILDNENITRYTNIARARFIAQVMQDPRIGTIENMSCRSQDLILQTL